MHALLLTFAFLLTSSVEDTETAVPHEHTGLKIVGFPKEGRMEADGTGHYATLVREVLLAAGYTDTLITAPVRRALRFFETEDEVCLVPVSKSAVLHQYPQLQPNTLIESRPIDYVSGHIITPYGTSPIRDPSALEGKVVGSWAGVQVKAFFPNLEFTLLQTESEENAIKMLHSGRVDAIWGWIPDAYILYERMGLGEPVMADDKPIFGSSAHFVCRNTPAARAFIPRIDPAIDTMRQDGRLKEILGKHARIVGVDVPMPPPNK